MLSTMINADGRYSFLSFLISILAAKTGMKPEECLDVAKFVVEECKQLRLLGLMTIGSPDRDVEDGINPDFEVIVHWSTFNLL